MARSRFYSVCGALFGVVFLTQCAGPGVGPVASERYVPRVSIPDPSRMSANENRFLPEVEDVLVRAGYRPTQGSAEYRLEMHLEDGPVNADSARRLLRGGSEVANARARVGGITTIFRRSQVVEESFRRCLTDFESQVSSSSPARDHYNGGAYPDRGGYPAQPAQDRPDWQRGW